MARKEAGIKHTMLTQDFEPEHWDWENNDLAVLHTRNVEEISKIIIRKIESAVKNAKVTECYAIHHDKDTKMGWDDVTQQPMVEYKQNHGHYVLKFNEPIMLNEVANAVGLKPEFVERPKAGRYSYDNMLAYLIHIKNPDKYQYDVNEVCAVRGESYLKIHMERKQAWEKGRAKKQAQEAKHDVEWLRRKILTGEVKREQVLLTDEYFEIYAMNKRICEEAFDTYTERKTYKTIQRMENGEFKTSVFFITGRPGTGKSYFSDRLAERIIREAKENMGEEWTVCSTAASNPFDEFMGDEVLMMDDVRGMSLSASDWLKLLDPDRPNVGSARYKNKRMACRVIIINSEKSPFDFFYYMKGMGTAGSREAMDQFFRRILARVIVYNVDGERKFQIGTVEKLNEPIFHRPSSLSGERVPLTYDFTKDSYSDMTSEQSIDFLVKLVAKNNWERNQNVTYRDTICGNLEHNDEYEEGNDNDE